MRKTIKCIPGLFTLLLLLFVQPAFAAGPPAPSLFSSPLAVTLIILMVLLLVVIGILGSILVGAADVRLKKQKASDLVKPVATVIMFLFFTSPVFAQGGDTAKTAAPAGDTIGGIDKSTFYIMIGVIFVELLTVIVMLMNIRQLLKKEKEKFVTEEEKTAYIKEKASQLSWWDRFNKLKPVTEEAELDLGHDYDGIRELNNRLPPWWLYGFYITIVFAGIYLWRFHVSHTGPSSKEEYEAAVASGEQRVQEYLKQKGETVDENTVTLLTDKADIEEGKAIFHKDGYCKSCHGEDGSGMVMGNPGAGPNLTDDYWIYGGSIKNIFKTVKYGTSKGMRTWKDDLSAKQMAQVSSYVKTLRGTVPPEKGKAKDGELYVEEAAPGTKPAADSANAKKPG